MDVGQEIKPQNDDLELFIAENDENFKLDPITFGIEQATLKGVNIHNVPGDYLAIIDSANDKILTRML